MSGLPVVAVAGGTGVLGKELVGALLEPQFRSKYRDVILLTRNSKSPDALSWSQKGATIRQYSELDDQSVVDALAGVDVLVNVVASLDGGFKHKLAAALTSPSSNVKLYFPSEFGVEHYLHEFQHPEWDKKKAHFDAVSVRKDLKICRVFPGLFMEHSVGPWFGLNTKEGKYEFIGSGNTAVSFTALVDIGRAVASALANIPIQSFPEKLYIEGDSVSLRQISELMEQAGAGKIEVSQLDEAEYKAKTLSTTGLNPAAYLRFLMAEGRINNKDQSNNELVNPGEKFWKWKRMADYAKDTAGRPWANL